MSMHVIEDLVQISIEHLDRHFPSDDGRLRDWFTALFAFQSLHDCSHTQHRVMEILVRRGHTLRLPVAEHPDYPVRRDFFDGLTEFTTLREFGPDEAEFADELADGYVDPPWLYCEYGTALWSRMTNRAPAGPVPLIEVVAAVAEAAEAAGDVETIAFWWALGHQTLVGGTPFDTGELAATPGVTEFRTIVQRSGAHRFDLPDGVLPPEEVWDDELEIWWYRLQQI